MLHYEIAITLVYFKIYSQVIAKREPFYSMVNITICVF